MVCKTLFVLCIFAAAWLPPVPLKSVSQFKKRHLLRMKPDLTQWKFSLVI